jgi:hypothetical protein|tara:strand:- start:27 stop:404 length:378 start_codon:yes stop_codon:yes gene_type:complete
MNKEELNKEIEKLKVSLSAHEEQVKDLQHDLKVAEQRLEDADKPKLTEKQFQAIESAIDNGVRNFSFDDADCYDYEMAMEYDNKVYLSHINFEPLDDLADEIYKSVEKCFGITDESDDTQDVTNE